MKLSSSGRLSRGHILKKSCWLAALFILTPAGAQDLPAVCGGKAGFPEWVQSGTYRGTIGLSPIFLRLNRHRKTEETGTVYFYERQGFNLLLSPFYNSQQLILQEHAPNSEQQVSGCFTLSHQGSALTGSWSSTRRQPGQPVQLKPFNVQQMPLMRRPSPLLLKLRQTDPLNFIKMNRRWVRVGQKLREPYSGLEYVRIPRSSAALSATLQDQQLRAALNALACRSEVTHPVPKSYALSNDLTWVSRELIGIEDHFDAFCGGAHPNEWVESQILNRATGKTLKLTAIWPRLTPQRVLSLYRSKLLPRLEPRCREVIQQELAGESDSADEMTVTLSNHGLVINTAALPHAVHLCGEEVVVPYATLRREANPKSPYYHEIYR